MPDQPGTNTTTATAQPYLPQQTYLQGGWNEALNLYNQGAKTPAATSMLEGIFNDPVRSAQITQGRNSLANIATGHDAWQPTQTLQDFESGKFLDPNQNPWLQNYYNDAAGRLRGQIASQFSGAGRYGSGAMGDSMATGLSNLANQMFGGAYQQGMQNMLAASQFRNNLGASNIRDQANAAALLGQYDTSEQGRIAQLIAAQQSQINAPWDNLAKYMGAVGGSYGGQTTTQTPYYTNPTGQAIGGLGGLASAGYLASQALGKNGFGLFGNSSASAGPFGGIGDAYNPDIWGNAWSGGDQASAAASMINNPLFSY